MLVQQIAVPPATEKQAVEAACSALKSGGTVVIPTDTVYGIAAHPGIPAALEEIYRFKRRERGKPIAMLAGSLTAVEKLVGRALTSPERRLAEACWPGALTLIVNTPRGSEGVRIPDLLLTRRIIDACGGLLRVTSANLSGEPETCDGNSARELIQDTVQSAGFEGAVPLLINAGATAGGIASTVAMIEGNTLRVLRRGVLSAASLAEIAGIPSVESL